MKFEVYENYRIVDGLKVNPGDVLLEDGSITKMIAVHDRLEVHRYNGKYWRTDWIPKGRDRDVDTLIALAKMTPTAPDGLECRYCGQVVESNYCGHCGQAAMWKYWSIDLCLSEGLYTVYGNDNPIYSDDNRANAIEVFRKLIVANPTAKVVVHSSQDGDWQRATL